MSRDPTNDQAGVLDGTQVVAFIEYMTGFRCIAVNPENGEEFGPPYSPELRAFLVARMGDDMPVGGRSTVMRHQSNGRALVQFLRQAADSIEQVVGK